ncbi:MAG: MATE family efflux transporter [Pyrinomonadaceae bacterium]
MLNTSENSVAQAENNSFLSILREAFFGSQRDFTNGSIGLAIFILSVPMILEMLGESLFAIVDIFFVGHLGADSVAIVGLTESIMALVYAVAIGLSIGATATVARRFGEKDAEGAAKSAAHVIYLGVIVSIVMSIAGIIFAPAILNLLGAESQIIAEGATFMRIMLGGNAVVVFIFLLNAIFRGAGDAAIAMRVLWLANLLNIFLSPCFIYGKDIFAFLGINASPWIIENWIFPHLGVTGAAIGTTIGRGCGVLFAVFWLLRKGGRIMIHRENWKLDTGLLWSIIKISSSAVLQFLISTASWSALVRVVAGFGSQAIAGYVIALRVVMFALLPSVGLSNAAATLVGQNLGAGRPERSEKSVWRAAIINAFFLGLIGLLFVFFSQNIVGIFSNDELVVGYSADALRIVAYGFVFYAFGMVLETAFNGAGDTWTPTYLNFFVFWLFEIPLAYILAYHFKLGTRGVFWAITIAFSVLAIAAAILFKRGKWKLKKV